MSDCGIVKDLLPLYADNVCSIESKKLVVEHLADCEACQKELDSYELDIKAKNAIEKEAVKRFKKKTERRIIKKVISLVLVVVIGAFGAFNVYWYFAFKRPFYRYEKMANEYFHEYKEKNITPITAVLGEENSYGIDVDEYESLGFVASRSNNYYANGGFVETFANRNGNSKEVCYYDKDSIKGTGISVQVSKNNKCGYEYLVMFEYLVDENGNDIYFYIDEDMKLILNTGENYSVNFYHNLGDATEKELQDKHNIIRQEIYEEVYDDIRVMMIVLYEGFGIGNVKA